MQYAHSLHHTVIPYIVLCNSWMEHSAVHLQHKQLREKDTKHYRWHLFIHSFIHPSIRAGPVTVTFGWLTAASSPPCPPPPPSEPLKRRCCNSDSNSWPADRQREERGGLVWDLKVCYKSIWNNNASVFVYMLWHYEERWQREEGGTINKGSFHLCPTHRHRLLSTVNTASHPSSIHPCLYLAAGLSGSSSI